MMIENSILKRLPDHLRQYIKPQPYEQYAAIDQAVWRYVMQKNVDFHSRYAHKSYRDGLDKTGISLDRIPNLYGMNRILKEIGWAAVAVDGFIPPRAFMEFQAYNVLVIASEIRQLEHIEYTPAPDIIHESAGHAPLLADPEYAAFLKRFGEIGSKAISNPRNHKMFHAIRKLSILKEQKKPNPKAIEAAEQDIQTLQNEMVAPSEMDQLRNLHWWSVEYGLIGTPVNFKLYGAGLLSSIGESQWCLSNKVAKLPFTPEVVHQRFDITQPQPQLFVTPNFAHLSKVLETVADTLSLRKGGLSGLKKLITSEEVGTVELSTGLQITGRFVAGFKNPHDPAKAAYIQTKGQTALAYRNQELIGHSCKYHPDGFGSPIGKLKGSNLAIEDMTPGDLEAFGLVEGHTIRLVFESGVVVEGKIITGIRNLFGKIMVITFQDCTVRFEDRVLFQPDWGAYDMAIGKTITSVYAGPADVQHFPFEKQPLMETKISPASEINRLYEKLEAIDLDTENTKTLAELGHEVLKASDAHWLLVLNYYEICLKNGVSSWSHKSRKRLESIMQNQKTLAHLVADGIQFINKK